jgi:hypothetical protein
MIESRQIFVTFTKEGIHRYPAALTDPKLNKGTGGPESWLDVSFLGHPHRHIFHFRVSISVEHNDRDIEFIQFKRELENQYSQSTLNIDYKSCEMLSEDLIEYIDSKYPNRLITVEVSEDGENGAILANYRTR